MLVCGQLQAMVINSEFNVLVDHTGDIQKVIMFRQRWSSGEAEVCHPYLLEKSTPLSPGRYLKMLLKRCHRGCLGG